MGRIKTKLINRITHGVLRKGEGEFTTDFEKNKKVVEKYVDVSSKKLRNIIAGYTTRIVKREQKK